MPEPTQARDYIRLYESLMSDRTSFEHHWQECSDYSLPRQSDITTRRIYQGDKKMSKVYDSSAIQAVEDMASELHGILTNPATFFFGLSVGNDQVKEDYQSQLWLDIAVKKFHEILAKSNFQTEVHDVYLGQGCFGTSVLRMEEDFSTIVRFKSDFIGDCFMMENAYGVIDTLVRRFRWRADKAYEVFGNELPKQIIETYNRGEITTRFEFIHVVMPRRKRDPSKSDPKNLPFKSVYLTCDDAKIVRESGFNEFPYSVPRWTVLGGEDYGRSPAMKALPDIKMLNRMEQTMIRAGQKVVDPPLLINNKGSISPVRTMPGGLTFISPQAATARDPIQPLYGRNSINLPWGWEMQNRKRAAIREAFFLDVLDGGDVKTHVPLDEHQTRRMERLRKLGPILSRLQSELLKPVVNRLFGIAFRRGDILPPPPPALQGQEVDIEFTSPVAKVQRMEEAESLIRTLGALGPVVEMKPHVLDNYDEDVITRDISEISSMPKSWLKAPDVVQQIRQERAEQIQQEQEEAKMLAGIEAASKLPAPEAVQ